MLRTFASLRRVGGESDPTGAAKRVVKHARLRHRTCAAGVLRDRPLRGLFRHAR
jgi:hypothetical protein